MDYSQQVGLNPAMPGWRIRPNPVNAGHAGSWSKRGFPATGQYRHQDFLVKM